MAGSLGGWGWGWLGQDSGGLGAAPWTPASLPGIVALYTPKGAASLAASYVNRANPGTYDAAPGVAPTWDAVNGWTGDGATTYLTTGIVHAQGWSILARFTGGANGATDSICGAGDAAPDTRLMFFARFDALAPNSVAYGGGGALSVAPQAVSGTLAVAGQQGYRDGIADGGAIGAWAGVNTRDVWLLSVNNNGANFGFFGGSVQIVIICSTALSAADVLLAHTWMMAQ